MTFRTFKGLLIQNFCLPISQALESFFGQRHMASYVLAAGYFRQITALFKNLSSCHYSLNNNNSTTNNRPFIMSPFSGIWCHRSAGLTDRYHGNVSKIKIKKKFRDGKFQCKVNRDCLTGPLRTLNQI